MPEGLPFRSRQPAGTGFRVHFSPSSAPIGLAAALFADAAALPVVPCKRVDVGSGDADPETISDWYTSLTKGKLPEE